MIGKNPRGGARVAGWTRSSRLPMFVGVRSRAAIASAAFALALLGAGGAVRAASDVRAVGNPHGPLRDECSTCHGPNAWVPAQIPQWFDHGRFAFPLEGTHVQAACRSCHLSLVFSESPDKCSECHQDAHRGELGNDCALCHTPRSFIDRSRMRRAHMTTRFPLTGAHAGADCENCHSVSANRMYVNTPTDCVACHLQDYYATRSPNHLTVGFSQDCVSCHNTVAFQPARFANHDAAYFPIFSGTHKGTWATCSDCHVSSTNFANFSCLLGCHTHADQTQVTNQHQGVPGFSYDSPSCYACHPDGRKP